MSDSLKLNYIFSMEALHLFCLNSVRAWPTPTPTHLRVSLNVFFIIQVDNRFLLIYVLRSHSNLNMNLSPSTVSQNFFFLSFPDLNILVLLKTYTKGCPKHCQTTYIKPKANSPWGRKGGDLWWGALTMLHKIFGASLKLKTSCSRFHNP